MGGFQGLKDKGWGDWVCVCVGPDAVSGNINIYVHAVVAGGGRRDPVRLILT